MFNDLRLGIDMGGTKTEAVVLRPRPRESSGTAFEELARLRRPTEAHLGYEHVLEGTAALIEEAARTAGLSALPPIGVGMPGNVTEAGLCKNSNATCLNGRPFRAELTARLGHPVVFGNDANCFALAETVLGAARGARVAFGVILGTGVGGGVIITENGVPKIWEGTQGIAGEWGHIVLEPETGPPCYCTRRGCVERYLAGPSIEAAYREKTGEKRPLVEIAARQNTDDAARQVIERALDVFGRALAAVIGVLDPDVVVLGGGVSNLDVLYTKGVEAVGRWVFSDTLRTRIVKHEIGDSAGVLGAALLP